MRQIWNRYGTLAWQTFVAWVFLTRAFPAIGRILLLIAGMVLIHAIGLFLILWLLQWAEQCTLPLLGTMHNSPGAGRLHNRYMVVAGICITLGLVFAVASNFLHFGDIAILEALVLGGIVGLLFALYKL